MIGSLLTMVLAAGGSADALTKYQVKTLTLQVPAAWTRSVEDGSHKFVAPSGDAFFLVDVGAVQTAGMSGDTCVKKIVGSIGGEGWERLNIGAAPAAKKTDVDTAPENQGQVETVTWVGCDGKTTWSVTFHMEVKKKERFAELAQKVAASVKYTRAGGK
jgi:hypothetical protein